MALGGKLVVALVSSGIGSVVGLSAGLEVAKRPFLQTITTAQPARVARRIFHPSENLQQAPEPPRARDTTTTTESPVRGTAPQGSVTAISAESVRTASALKADRPARVVAINSANTSQSATAAPQRKALERSSSDFGYAEIIDPWETKR